jgi:peptidyl-prolyl cis-trans isomerase C
MTPLLKKIAVCFALSFSTLCFAQNAVIVNGTPIPLSKLNHLIESSGQADNPEVRKQAREVLITKELINQEANKRGITKNPKIQDALEQAKLSVLVSAVFEEWLTNGGITDADLQGSYDAMKSQMSGKEYKVSHILVDNEKLANSLLAQIKAGAKFADLAKANSLDKGSAENGGTIDWLPATALVPEFSKAMTSLTPGQLYATPVKTEFGWHIIQLNDVREQVIPPMQEVKPQLVQMLSQDKNWQKEKFSQMMESFKSKAKIQ